MPVSKTDVLTGGDQYPAIHKGEFNTRQVQLDVSSLDGTDYVDSDGFMVPGVPLMHASGELAEPHPGEFAIQTADTTGNILIVSGDQRRYFSEGDIFRVTGSTGNDGTYQVASVAYDSTNDETDITVEGSIGDGTGDGNIRAEIVCAGIVPFSVEVADSDSTTDLDAATDIDVAIAVNGVFSKETIEDILGRTFNTNEDLAFAENDALVLEA